jgi:hypothetical protein
LVTQSDANFDFNNVDGLLDVNLTKIASSATMLGVTVKLDYGSGANQIAVKGLVLSNFSLIKTADGSTINITALAESTATEGQYVLTIANTTLNTPIKLKVLATSNYEGELSTPL